MRYLFYRFVVLFFDFRLKLFNTCKINILLLNRQNFIKIVLKMTKINRKISIEGEKYFVECHVFSENFFFHDDEVCEMINHQLCSIFLYVFFFCFCCNRIARIYFRAVRSFVNNRWRFKFVKKKRTKIIIIIFEDGSYPNKSTCTGFGIRFKTRFFFKSSLSDEFDILCRRTFHYAVRIFFDFVGSTFGGSFFRVTGAQRNANCINNILDDILRGFAERNWPRYPPVVDGPPGTQKNWPFSE